MAPLRRARVDLSPPPASSDTVRQIPGRRAARFPLGWMSFLMCLAGLSGSLRCLKPVSRSITACRGYGVRLLHVSETSVTSGTQLLMPPAAARDVKGRHVAAFRHCPADRKQRTPLCNGTNGPRCAMGERTTPGSHRRSFADLQVLPVLIRVLARQPTRQEEETKPQGLNTAKERTQNRARPLASDGSTVDTAKAKC